MDKLRQAWRWFWSNLSNFALLGGWLVSAGFFPTLLALSREASPLAYGVAALSGVAAFFVLRLLYLSGRIMRATARHRERLTSGSSPFDPMEKVYRDKRLFLRDLAPLGRKEVKGRKFINCEIIGPGDIVIDMRSHESKPFPTMRDNTFHDVNLIQSAPAEGKMVHNAVFFPDCDFENCSFYSLNALFTHRAREDLNWITPPSAEEPMGLFRAEVAKEAEQGKKDG